MNKIKVLMLGLLIVAVPVGLAAQSSTTFDEMQKDFQAFTDDTAKALPMNSLVGTDWSDAYIGQLLGVPPHFGVGVTVGATAIPTDGIVSVMDALGIEDQPPFLQDGVPIMGGIPLPAAVLNGRVGGVLLPFDVGAKIGMIPGGGMDLGGYQVDFLLGGFDARYAVLKGGAVLPKVSVGAGINYLRGSMAAADLGGYTLDSIELGEDTYSAEFTDTKLAFAWQTLTLDAKAQVSKNFLIVMPYGGVGVTMPVSATAGGGFTGDVKAYKGDEEIGVDDLQQAADAAGYELAVDEEGFTVLGTASNIPVARVYGGASLSILLVKLDVGLKFNINDQSMGLDIGTRVQL